MNVEPDHAAHEPGTRENCPECAVLAYEPGWYKDLREHRVVARPSAVIVPEAGSADVDVALEETPPLEPAPREGG